MTQPQHGDMAMCLRCDIPISYRQIGTYDKPWSCWVHMPWFNPRCDVFAEPGHANIDPCVGCGETIWPETMGFRIDGCSVCAFCEEDPRNQYTRYLIGRRKLTTQRLRSGG